MYKSVTINQFGDINGAAAIEEWPVFHKYIVEKYKAKEELQEQERDIFCASETSFDAYRLYPTYLNDKTCATIFPN